MRRMLLAGLLVALTGALAVVALSSLGGPVTTARSGPAAPPAGPAESGPFALAAERTRERRERGFVEAAVDRHRAAGAARRTDLPRTTRRGGMLGERMVAQVARDLADRLDVEEERMRSALASVGRDALSRRIRRDRRRWPLLKHEAIDAIARALDRSPGDVASAARNELEAKLRRGVTFGAVSDRGRDLALACFDAPQTCDVQALRREVRGAR